MLDTIINVLKFIFNLFNSLPKDQQQEIKDAVINQFEEIFRGFYKQTTGK